MNLKELYKYIKPIIDIYFYKYFGEKRDFIINMIKILDVKSKPETTQEGGFDCELINKIYYYVLFSVFILLIIWILYDTFQKNYKSISHRIGLLIKDQIRLKDIPEFKQIEYIFYFTENFSLNIDLTLYLVFIAVILYIAYKFNNMEINEVYIEFNMLLPILFIMMVLGIAYFLYNYTFFNLLAKRTHSLNDIIYKNINSEFIEKYTICNYTEKKNKFDDYFQNGKCNDIKYNFNQNKLYAYISSIINEIYNIDNEITLNKFKTLKDKNGVLYKTKLSSAFYTFILVRYYIDNNLLDDAKEMFSTYNLISILPRINPILSLNYDSLIFNSSNSLNYELPKMQQAFNNNKDIYNYIYNDFYNNNSIIQELIVDIYNICKYKMISLYDYYVLNGIIIVCIIIYYFIKYYFKN